MSNAARRHQAFYECLKMRTQLRTVANKGVFAGPSGPSREGPGIGYKIASDTKLLSKGEKKKKIRKGKRKNAKRKRKGKKEKKEHQ